MQLSTKQTAVPPMSELRLRLEVEERGAAHGNGIFTRLLIGAGMGMAYFKSGKMNRLLSASWLRDKGIAVCALRESVFLVCVLRATYSFICAGVWLNGCITKHRFLTSIQTLRVLK